MDRVLEQNEKIAKLAVATRYPSVVSQASICCNSCTTNLSICLCKQLSASAKLLVHEPNNFPWIVKQSNVV